MHRQTNTNGYTTDGQTLTGTQTDGQILTDTQTDEH
jgi:hypothetical protein